MKQVQISNKSTLHGGQFQLHLIEWFTLEEKKAVTEIRTQKNIALAMFLIVDMIQIAFVSFLTFDEQSLLVLGFDLAYSNPYSSISVFAGICIAQILLVYLFTAGIMNKKEMIQLYPKYDASQTAVCEYSREEIVQWTKELAKKGNLKIDRIFLMQSPIPNAFTFSLPLMGSTIVLHSNTLDFLLPNEVKSIIAHELGHIKNDDSIANILTHVPGFFVQLIYLYIYLRIGLSAATSLIVDFNPLAGVLRIAVLVGFFILSRFMVNVSKLFTQKASRDAELLADFYSAEIAGPNQTINALIRLGQRVEAITIFVEELKWLDSLSHDNRCELTGNQLREIIFSYPLDEIDEANARAEAPRIYLTRKLKKLRKDYKLKITDEEIKAAVDPAVESLNMARETKRKLKNLEKKTIDWREVDYNRDERLDDEELVDLVDLLRNNPRKLMFTNEVGAKLLMIGHPDFRKRILKLANHYGL